MSDGPGAASVLAWSGAAGAAPLEALWRRLERLGWLRPDTQRVVVQLARPQRPAVAVDTARALVEHLVRSRTGLVVEVLDPGAVDGEWVRTPAIDVRETLRVAGTAARGDLTVPRVWFTPFFLVTVAGIGRAPGGRIAAVLAAQASVLESAANPWPPHVLAYEAHRLARSDLSIACGETGPPAARWWAVSPSDVAVDRAVARAAGLEIDEVPALRTLARHELLPSMIELDGALPSLAGCAAPAWQARLQAGGWAVRVAGRALAHDVRAARDTLGRFRGLVWRRLARHARRRSAA